MTATLSPPAPTAPAAPPPAGSIVDKKPREPWSTPRWLVVLGTVAGLFAIGLNVFGGLAASSVGTGLNVIGNQTAPAVRVASDLSYVLSNMDTQVANVLVIGTGKAQQFDRGQALHLYQSAQEQADTELSQAVADGGNDPVIQQSVQTILTQLGQYEGLVDQAFLINEQGNDPAGAPSEAALGRYRLAEDLMQSILAGMQRVTVYNHELLNTTYDSVHSTAESSEVWLIVLGVLTIVALLVVQVHTRRRLRRRLNPAVLVATVLTLVFTITGAGMFANEANQLNVATNESFTSIVALSQARAAAYDSKSAESRWLVDSLRASDNESEFLADSLSIVGLKGVTSVGQFDAAYAAALNDYHANNANITFSGYLGTEMNNLTFPGERATAEQALAAFQAYQLDDRTLRALVASGHTADAITLDQGADADQSQGAFAQFDGDLSELIQLNQNAFDDAINAGNTDLGGWTSTIPVGTAVLVLILLGAGLWPG